jgi:hypothetical protein
MTILNSIEEEARWLAQYNKRTNPDIKNVYWFPAENEIRLLETTEEVPFSEEEKDVSPFYFPAFRDEDVHIKHKLAIALIRPECFGNLNLPENWGSWDCGRLINDG